MQQELDQGIHWEFISALKKKADTTSTNEYEDWSGVHTVNGQEIYFEGSIHKASVPNQTGVRAVYMLNRLADFTSTAKPYDASYRFFWVLKHQLTGEVAKGSVFPRYVVASGDNCSAFNEAVPFQAEDVLGVFIFKRSNGQVINN